MTLMMMKTPPGGVPEKPPACPEEPKCAICYNPFDGEVHLPKMLECLHTFCVQCLRQMHLRWGAREGSIPCPLCRHPTLLPEGSLQNLPVNSKAAKGCPGSPAVPLQTWAPASQHPLQGHSRPYLPPGVTAGEHQIPAAQVEAQEGCPCAEICCLLIMFLVAVGTAVAAVYLGLQDHKKIVLFVMLIILSTFFFCVVGCTLRSINEQQRRGERGRRVVSSQQRSNHHDHHQIIGDDQPWGPTTAASWTSSGGHVGSGWGGFHVDSDMISGDAGFDQCHMDSGMTTGDGGFGGCHADSGISSGDCGFSECHMDSGFDGCDMDSGCCGD